MRTSETIDLISGALALAQAEFKPVAKNKQNPHFKNWYADLASIFDATRPSLSKHGIAISQFPSFSEGRVEITTRLLHKSGQWLENTLSLKPSGDTPQALGSAITYGKRYGVEAILGVSGEDEDDGNEASKSNGNQNYPQKGSNSQPHPPKVSSAPVPMPQIEIFDAANPQMLDRLKKRLDQVGGIDYEDYDAIALFMNGKLLTAENFKEALALKQG